MELHGGSVSARSEGPGRGSEFIVRLPAAEDRPADPRPRPPPPKAEPRRSSHPDRGRQPGPGPGPGPAPECWATTSEAAHDGPEGIEAARDYRPDVILLDIGLPGLDGYQVARTLRHEGFRDP